MTARLFPSIARSVAWLVLALVALGAGTTAPVAAGETPKAVITVKLESPEFLVNIMKYRVLFLKTERKFIPLSGYDFGAALADELLNVLAEDSRLEWRLTTEADGLDAGKLWNDSTRRRLELADGAKAVLLVDVIEYGAFVTDLGKDKFFVHAGLKLVDTSTGKRIWQKKHFLRRSDLEGKLDALQADEQKGLKLGINAALEEFCRETAAELKKVAVPQ